MSTETTTSRKPGRPPVVMNWPNGEFTVDQLQASTGLSKVTLYQKVNDALSNNVITVVGKETTKQGRPRTLFKKKTSTGTTSSPVVAAPPQPVAVAV